MRIRFDNRALARFVMVQQQNHISSETSGPMEATKLPRQTPRKDESIPFGQHPSTTYTVAKRTLSNRELRRHGLANASSDETRQT